MFLKSIYRIFLHWRHLLLVAFVFLGVGGVTEYFGSIASKLVSEKSKFDFSGYDFDYSFQYTPKEHQSNASNTWSLISTFSDESVQYTDSDWNIYSMPTFRFGPESTGTSLVQYSPMASDPDEAYFKHMNDITFEDGKAKISYTNPDEKFFLFNTVRSPYVENHFLNSPLGRLYDRIRFEKDSAKKELLQKQYDEFVKYLAHSRLADTITGMFEAIIDYQNALGTEGWMITADKESDYDTWVKQFRGVITRLTIYCIKTPQETVIGEDGKTDFIDHPWTDNLNASDINTTDEQLRLTIPTVIQDVSNDVNPMIRNDFFNYGMGGRMGNVFHYIIKNGNTTLEEGVTYFLGDSITETTVPSYADLFQYGSFRTNNLQGTDYYGKSPTETGAASDVNWGVENGLTNADFYLDYNRLIAGNAGYEVGYRNSFVMNNLTNGRRYRVVDQETVGDNLVFYDKADNYDPTDMTQVVVSPAYAKIHNYVLGDYLQLNDTVFVVTAIGTDVMNLTPTMDNETIAEPDKNGVVYVSHEAFVNSSTATSDVIIRDDSRIFLVADKSMEQDINLFINYNQIVYDATGSYFSDNYNLISAKYLYTPSQTPWINKFIDYLPNETTRHLLYTGLCIGLGIVLMAVAACFVTSRYIKTDSKVELSDNAAKSAASVSIYPMLAGIIFAAIGVGIGVILQDMRTDWLLATFSIGYEPIFIWPVFIAIFVTEAIVVYLINFIFTMIRLKKQASGRTKEPKVKKIKTKKAPKAETA